MASSRFAARLRCHLCRPPRESAVLDLVAVLEGLVPASFEIIVVTPAASRVEPLADLRAREPRLPLRLVPGDAESAGGAAAAFDLILMTAADGRFDIRELNHLFEAAEQGADGAVGYRPRRTDRILRRLVGLDWAYYLVTRRLWQQVAQCNASFAKMLPRLQRLGYRIAEVPVRSRRPTLGIPLARKSRAALVE